MECMEEAGKSKCSGASVLRKTVRLQAKVIHPCLSVSSKYTNLA